MSEEHKRLYEEAQRRLREVATLYEASQACLSISDQKGLLAAIIEAAARATDATLGSVMLIDEEKGEYVFGAHYGLAQETIAAIEAKLHIPLGEGLAGSVATTGQPVVVADVTTDPRWISTETEERIHSFLGVPLVGRDEQPLGALTLACREVGAFDKDHARLLSTFANQAAMAIENARLYEQAQQEIAERKQAEEALRETEQRWRSLLDNSPDIILTVNRDAEIQFANCVDPSLVVEEVIGSRVYDFIPSEQHDMYRQNLEKAFQSGKIVSIENQALDRWYTSRFVPIEQEKKVTSVMVIGTDITERKRAEEEREQRSRELAMLNETGRAVTSSLDLKEVLALLLDRARQGLDAEACSVALLNDNGDLVFHHAEGEGAEAVVGLRLKPGQGIAGWVAQSGQSALVPDAHADPHFYGEVAPGFTTRDMVCVPLVVRDEVIGVIELLNKRQGTFAEDDVRVLESVSTQAATAIENARLYERARWSEERYRDLFENANDLIFTLDQDLNISDVNKMGEQLTGYSVEEARGMNISQFLSPKDLERTRLLLADLLAGELIPQPFETEIIRKDGGKVLCEITGRLIEKEGEPVRVHCIARDITERKRAEEALRESEERYRSIFETVPVSIILIGKDGQIVDINPYHLTHIAKGQIPKEEFIGKNIVTHPTVVNAGLSETYKRVLEGEPFEQKDVYFPTTMPGTDGYFNVKGAPLLKDSEVIGAVIMHQDITERKRAEEALRESEERYRTLVEGSRDAIYMTIREGKFVDFNRSALDLFGYTREEMMRLDVRDLYADPADRYRFQQEVEQKGAVRDYEIKLRKKDGTEMDCLLTSTVRRANDGSILGYQGIIRNITERKRAEERLRQAQKMEAIGQLAGGLAHDFNNLLTPIGGFADLLMWKTPDDSRQYEYLRQIKGAAERAAALTYQLLTLARRVQVEVRPLSLNDVVHEVIGLLERTIDRAIAIEPHLTDDLATVEGDAGQLHQVLLNLCLNARDAMPDGGQLTIETQNVTLSEAEARTELDLEAGQYVLLSVTDTGRGMDAETQQRLFEPFFTTKEQGRGLGLAMVYSIVRGHGGAIRAYSKPGQGSTFKVYLPVTSRPAEDMVPEEAEAVGGRETVLVVDDEESVRALLQRILEDGGYTVLLATDGIEASELYAERGTEIDLVVLDIIMPRMGGRKTYERLREINPEVKVLLTSGYSESGQAQDILAAGAKGFLQKPYDLRAVLRKVREVLEG